VRPDDAYDHWTRLDSFIQASLCQNRNGKGFTMDETTGFRWHCTQNHDVCASFAANDLEALRHDVDRGEVSLYCIRCDQSYRLGPELIANIKNWLSTYKPL